MSGKPFAEASTWLVLAHLDQVHAVGFRRQVVRRGDQYALVEYPPAPGAPRFVAGPATWAEIQHIAEHVAIGDPKATTWPKTLGWLALGLIALQCEYERALAPKPEEKA